QHDLLLVTAGQRTRDRFERSRLDSEAINFAGRCLAFTPALKEAEAVRIFVQRDHRYVVFNAVVENEAFFLAVFGDETDALVDCDVRGGDTDVATVDGNRAGRWMLHAKERLHHLGASRADQAEEAEDFTG